MTHPSSHTPTRNRYRVAIVLSLVVIIPLGLVSKFYQGWGYQWVNGFAGAILYEMFWIWLVALFFPRINTLKITLGVLLLTCVLEFLQLWHPPFLTQIRATFIGKMLLGTTFVWWDFPYYFLGCGLGWLGLLFWQRLIFDKNRF